MLRPLRKDHDSAVSPSVEERLWTVDDVARYLTASRSWVYKAAERGDLPCLRIGSMLRFDPAAVRAFANGAASRQGRIVALPAARTAPSLAGLSAPGNE